MKGGYGKQSETRRACAAGTAKSVRHPEWNLGKGKKHREN